MNDKKSLKNLLKSKVNATDLEEGIHENVFLVSIDINDRKDHTGTKIKKQCFLMFKKIDSEGGIIGQKEISFFFVDPVKEYALDNLIELVQQIKCLLSAYLSDKDILKKYNPVSVLIEKDEEITEELGKEFLYDNIRNTRLKMKSNYAKVENAAKDQLNKLLGKKIGLDSIPLRFKLVEDKNKYIQIPRFGTYVESMDVSRSDSSLIQAN
jgi:hypothetical protein